MRFCVVLFVLLGVDVVLGGGYGHEQRSFDDAQVGIKVSLLFLAPSA
jgi:hypothetical protein